jgi:hypothetical protein
VRLPWPFGRSSSSAGPTTPAGGERASAAPSTAQSAAQRVVAPTGAWATLPPIQRTVSPPPLVAPSGPFLADVPGHTPLPPIVQPLGHESGPTAPPGLVVAHARPVPSLTSSAPLPTRSVQRHAASPSGSRADQPGFEPVVVVAGEVSPAPGGGSAPETAPVRMLPAVPAAATVTPPTRSLTRAASSPTPLGPPLGGRSAGDRPAVQRSATPQGAAAPGPSTLPLPHTVSRWAEAGSRPAGGPSAPAADAAASSTAAAPGPATMSREPASRTVPAPAASRRPGLGAPISVQPASAVEARMPVRMSPPGPAVGGEPASGSEILGGRPGTGPASASTSGQAAPGPRALPVLSVARQRRDDPRADASQAAAQPAGAPAPNVIGSAHTRPSGPRPPSVVPLLGARPLRPTTQRQVAPVAAATTGADATWTPEPAVAARWARHDDLPPTVTSTGRPTAWSEPEPVPLGALGAVASSVAEPPLDAGPREIVFPSRDASPGPGYAPGAGSPSTPAIQRQASSMPGPSSIAGSSRTAGARSATAAASWTGPSGSQPPASTRAPAMTLAPSAGARPGSGSAGSSSGSATVAPAPATAPVVQASRDAGMPGLPGITAVPVVQRVDGAAPAAPSEEGQSDSELDELARSLFGRIRGQLRAEVIHEREARGLTFDAF